ncbi:hypothetical protein A0J61_07593 [Choanephora cucurbitarum]|uniref:Protein Zds1 C-terminal domain-containing protein n=1 Tax=Choanephora cucurbitarum TaxID=101091 RepID=A0A1C7N5F6_9FUNG|nr:hypothetical protein A0J61_07593 [Choanephora cucurbitarum]
MSSPVSVGKELKTLHGEEQTAQLYESAPPYRELSYYTTRNASERLDSILKSNLSPYQSNDIILTEKNTVETWTPCFTEKNQDKIKRTSKEHTKWTRIPLNEQDVPVQNSVGVTRYKSTPSHNLSLDEQERSSRKTHDEGCSLDIGEDEVCQLEVSDQLSSEVSPRSKRASWLYSLLNDFKRPHRLFLPITKKSTIVPSPSDTPPKKQRSFESLLHRKKPQPIPDSPIVYTRYPVQTEHAIYRLSHQKLSNSHRPLQQQVMISNLMFWYLSISNRKHKIQRGKKHEHVYASTPPSTEKASLDQMYMQKSYYASEAPKNSYQPIKNPYYSVNSLPSGHYYEKGGRTLEKN